MNPIGESAHSRPGGGIAEGQAHPEPIVDTPPQKYGALRWLLVLPYIALLWVPFYNHAMPSFAGFPFFYWYQFLWVPLTSLLIYIVYKVMR